MHGGGPLPERPASTAIQLRTTPGSLVIERPFPFRPGVEPTSLTFFEELHTNVRHHSFALRCQTLRSRLALQGQCAQTLLIADLQALSDSTGHSATRFR